MTILTRFENDVLAWLLEGGADDGAILRKQLRRAVITRQVTGAGFFLEFDVPDDCPKTKTLNQRINDLYATIEGLKYGADFVLWVVDGKLKTLEVCSFEEPWPPSVDSYKLIPRSQVKHLPM